MNNTNAARMSHYLVRPLRRSRMFFQPVHLPYKFLFADRSFGNPTRYAFTPCNSHSCSLRFLSFSSPKIVLFVWVPHLRFMNIAWHNLPT